MKNRSVIIGSRGSELALWQTRWIERALLGLHPSIGIEIRIIKTTGDQILDAPLAKIGDKGLFTKELEKSLMDGEIDLAVHSLKDVPTQIQNGLTLAAICEREDARDVFIGHPDGGYASLSDVPAGGALATSSLRRKCQLLHLRPDVKIADIRGNIQTRIEKLNASDWDGMLLAKAGITRLGLEHLITEVLPTSSMLPAVGQGALGVEIRADDEYVAWLLRPLNHSATRQATAGERALLRRLEGGCQIPIGAYGRIADGRFLLDAAIGSLDGGRLLRGSMESAPEDAEWTGTALADQLYSNGGKEILDEIRRTEGESGH